MPRSLEARGAILLLMMSASVGLPAWQIHRVLSARQATLAGKADAALLAVALTRYLEAAAEQPAESDTWLARLAGGEQRVRWAGVFDASGEGLEFQRRTGLRREEILAQIPFGSTVPELRPLAVSGRRSDRFMLLFVPEQEVGASLAAIIDLGGELNPGRALAISGLVALGILGLAATLAWFHFAIQRPVQRLGQWVESVRQDLSDAALAPELPDELAGLARALRQTQNELQKWRAEAGQLRYSLELQVDARTKRMSRALHAAERQAETDALTQLANRGSVERALPEMFDKAESDDQNLAVAMLDVNHFLSLIHI